LSSHVAMRPSLSSSLKPLPGTTAGQAVIKKHSKMLSDLYKQQVCDRPGEMAGISPPRTTQITALLSSVGRGSSEVKKAQYADPGLTHRKFKPGYTGEQLHQMFSFGVLDSAPKGPKNPAQNDPILHLETLLGHHMLFRNDDAHRLLLTSPFVFEPSISEGEQACKIIGFSSDASKVNRDGHAEAGGCMRHRTDPVMCCQFGLGYLFFYRWIILALQTPEFKPQTPNSDGVRVRPYYGEYLLPGYTKAARGLPVPCHA